jgi:flagellar motor protein MotB
VRAAGSKTLLKPFDYVSALGKGGTEPAAPNDTAENRAKNRRAVLEITLN